LAGTLGQNGYGEWREILVHPGHMVHIEYTGMSQSVYEISLKVVEKGCN
jgi:hypothetical protein